MHLTLLFIFSVLGGGHFLLMESAIVHVVLIHLKIMEFPCTRCHGTKIPKSSYLIHVLFKHVKFLYIYLLYGPPRSALSSSVQDI